MATNELADSVKYNLLKKRLNHAALEILAGLKKEGIKFKIKRENLRESIIGYGLILKLIFTRKVSWRKKEYIATVFFVIHTYPDWKYSKLEVQYYNRDMFKEIDSLIRINITSNNKFLPEFGKPEEGINFKKEFTS